MTVVGDEKCLCRERNDLCAEERRNDSGWGMRNVCVEKKNGYVWRAKE